MAEGCVNLQVLLSALAVWVGGAAAADEVVLPKSLERNQPPSSLIALIRL
jgi:hypothetical protein